MGATYLGSILTDVLSAAEDGVAEAHTSVPPPSRIYVSHAAPAIDVCEDDGVLVSYLSRMPHLHSRSATGRGRVPVGGCEVTANADIVVELWRCYPNMQDDGEPFPPSTYEAASVQLARDLWCLLSEGLYPAWLDGSLGAPCKAVTFGDPTPLGPTGGTAGWRVPLTVHLSDPSP